MKALKENLFMVLYKVKVLNLSDFLNIISSIICTYQFVRREGFIFNFYKFLSSSSSSKIDSDSLLIDFRSIAISWKDPCQSSAHSPLLEDKSKIRRNETGRKMITLVYSSTGRSSAMIKIRYSRKRHTRAIIVLKRVQNLVDKKRSTRTQ